MRLSPKKILIAATALIILLSACQPALPTQNANDTANQVATSVALTVAAQNALTQAAPTMTVAATNTTLPTQTEVVLLPSPTAVLATPTAILLPTSVSGGGGGGTTSQPNYACDTIHRRPFDNVVFRPNAKFDIKWTIVNTGKKTMRAGLDLHYNSGTKLTSTDRVELPELEPDSQYDVNFDAVAPGKEGTYIMTFIVEGGLCFPYTAIVVQK